MAIYSGYNATGWKPSGSSYYKHYRAWLEYWTSATSETAVTVAGYMGVNIDSSVNATYTGYLGASNYGTVSASGSTVFKNGNTVTLIGTHTYSYARTKSAYTIGITATVSSIQGSWKGEQVAVTGYITIPARQSWKVAYDANGGTGAPSAGAKYYETDAEKASASSGYIYTIGAAPTRTGYTFTGWNTAADGSGTSYAVGDRYTDNAELTLYAQWTANTYSIAFDGNGNTGGSTVSITGIVYDTTVTLAANGFTKTNYNFVGWAETSDGQALYSDGASVKNLAESGTKTLYAVWSFAFTDPELRSPNAERASSGVHDDFGTGAVASVYVTPAMKAASYGATPTYQATTVTAYYKLSTASSWTTIGSQTISTAQTVAWTVPDSTFGTDNQYNIRFVATCSALSSVTNSIDTLIADCTYFMDVDPVNKSFGFFAAAPTDSKLILIGEEADIAFELDETAASGTDYEIIEALKALGWIDSNGNWT